MRFRVLGPIEVYDSGGPVALSPRPREVLGVLLTAPNVTVSVDQLIDSLWAYAPPRSAVKTMQGYVHHLRRALGDQTRIRRAAGGYALVAESDEVDAARFKHLTAAGLAAVAARDDQRGIELLSGALDLWAGPAFAEVAAMQQVRGVVARLAELKQHVIEERVAAGLRLGRHRELLADLTGVVAEYPFREGLRAQLMLALHRSGRSAEALAVYREGHDLLAAELGIGPGRQLRAVRSTIMDEIAHEFSPSAGCPRCRV